MAEMNRSTKRYSLWIALLLLTLFAADAVYWTLFFAWRSAADPANNALWHPRFYVWFAMAVVAVCLWIADAVLISRDMG
jgi:uncharacterized membrane-anchored protein